MRRLLLALWLVASAASAWGSVFVVDPGGGGDFTTIQSATDAAANTDTIVVRPGDYGENVVCSGKCLTYSGAGDALTLLTAPAALPALEFIDMPSPSRSYVHGMTIEGHPSSEWTVRWNEHHVAFSGCVLLGKVGGGNYYGSVSLTNCSASEVRVDGGMRSSSVQNSVVGDASFWPGGEYSHHLDSSGSFYSTLKLPSGGADLLDDVIEHIDDDDARYEASDCHFGSVNIRGGKLRLTDCEVDGDIVLWGFSTTGNHGYFGYLSMSGCVVEGDVSVDVELYLDWSYSGLFMVHNTIRGDVYFSSTQLLGPNYVWPRHFRSNIVTGGAELLGEWSGAPPVATHNDCVHGMMVSEPSDSLFANGSFAPLFCDYFGADYQLQECSPCVAAAHDGGDIGALGIGCECATTVERRSWGRIKALYGQQPSN